MDRYSSVVVTRVKEVGQRKRVQGAKYMVAEDDSAMSGGHPMREVSHVSQ